ncbi:MAG: glutamine-hydrolyzing carbamoyl-phosphate synthase small subunit [Coriobacteriia bacterium]|nr:glutamine-hydrolyzing carbamoyl-phosphate synthase small subunit [Coriobacteriia bacterium]MDO9108065.1 glutamine-hydrolyzing carbamoyl-phosphate synthase small subunit [Coriobacteriia bacterium]
MTRARAILALEDGTVFNGFACGAQGEATGEICFNTSLSGYQEVLTDPSYAGQIVTMTMPHIGNYGVNGADMESRGVFARGFVVREMCTTPSNWRAEESLPEFLCRHGVVAIEGVDTRQLTRHIREAGAMRAIISTTDLIHESLVAKARVSAPLTGRDLVAEVAITDVFRWGDAGPEGSVPVDTGILPVNPRYHVVAMDSGIKYNILRQLAEAGCEVTVVPPTTSAAEVLALEPDGVFLANGPGDPTAVEYLYGTLRELLGAKPLFGICLGHQMLSLAVGCDTYKLKYGHRGGNQPVKNLLTGRVEITSQNHGFCVDFGSIGKLVVAESGGLSHDANDLAAWSLAGVAPVVNSERFGRIQLTHINLNDMTTEGIRLLDTPAFSVQYHPEAAPGPHDSRYLFGAFTRLMDGEPDYLSSIE